MNRSDLIKKMADRLLSGKETCFIGNRLHMEVVGNVGRGSRKGFIAG